jgi:hypothetical protein
MEQRVLSSYTIPENRGKEFMVEAVFSIVDMLWIVERRDPNFQIQMKIDTNNATIYLSYTLSYRHLLDTNLKKRYKTSLLLMQRRVRLNGDCFELSLAHFNHNCIIADCFIHYHVIDVLPLSCWVRAQSTLDSFPCSSSLSCFARESTTVFLFQHFHTVCKFKAIHTARSTDGSLHDDCLGGNAPYGSDLA